METDDDVGLENNSISNDNLGVIGLHRNDLSLEDGKDDGRGEIVSDSQERRYSSQHCEDDNDSLPLFCISKHDAKDISQVVKAMALRDHCTLSISNEGIRIAVDDQHNMQGSAYFTQEQFTEFSFRAQSCSLKIPMKPFQGWLFILKSGPYWLHRCTNILDLEFNADHILCKAILNPQAIRDIMQDLDDSAETVVITFTPNYLQFYMVGGLGRMKIEIPSNSEHLETLTCTRDRVQFRYRTSLFKKLKECIRLCNKLSFRIDERGILSSQMLVTQNEQNVFIDFYTMTENERYYEHES